MNNMMKPPRDERAFPRFSRHRPRGRRRILPIFMTSRKKVNIRAAIMKRYFMLLDARTAFIITGVSHSMMLFNYRAPAPCAASTRQRVSSTYRAGIAYRHMRVLHWAIARFMTRR